MADGDDDDEDGDDDGEDGEDGEEGDEEDGELADSEKGTPARQEDSVDPEIKNSPSVDPPIITTPAATTSDAMDISADEPPTAMPPVQPATLITSPPFEGSPLKNVSVPFSPTDAAVPNLPETPPAAAPDTSATEPIPAESADLETVAPEPQSDVPSDPIPSPILSVEVLEAPVVEAIIEEPTFVEPEVPVDTEMIDAASPQPELVVESQMTPPTEDDNGPAIIEEIIETVKSPPNDEVHPPSESTSPMGDDGVPEPVQSPIVEQPTVVHTIQITEVEEHSAVPIVNIPVADTGITATDIGSITLPALKPLQTEEPGTVPEEIVPESPDLLGGLEAALDRHSEPPAVLAAPVPENLPSNEAE